MSSKSATESRRIVLTGTTGNLGSRVLKHILDLLPPSSIIISLYNPSKAPLEAKDTQLELRRGDYEDPASLDKAFEDADVLFLMSYPSIRYGVRVNAHINAIEAAKRSSINHIVYTALAFAGGPDSTESIAAVMRAHLATETYLRTSLPSDMTYTIIREGLYTESFPLYLGFYDLAAKPSEVFIPAGDNEGLIAFTKRDELGEATAKIIAELINHPPDKQKGGEFVNRTILLAAEPKYSLTSLGELIGTILGTPPVVVNRIPPKEYATAGSVAAKSIGSPEMAMDWTTSYPAIGRGETGYQGEGSNKLEEILGRKPEAVEVTVKSLLK